jgi:hypothetical protein
MAIKLPTVAPKVNLPAAPKSSMTAFGTYPAGTMIGQLPKGPVTNASKIPVINNSMFGSNQIVQVKQPVPVPQQLKPVAPQPMPMPVPVKQMTIQQPASAYQVLVNNLRHVASAPVKPQPLMPAAQATQLKNTLSPLIPSKQAIATTQQNLAINQFLPKKSVASVRAPVAPERMVGYGRY